jgi:hypothetical protein
MTEKRAVPPVEFQASTESGSLSRAHVYHLRHNFFWDGKNEPKNGVAVHVWKRGRDYGRTIEAMIEKEPARTFHLWLTFEKPVPYHEAKKRAIAFVRKRLRQIIEAAVWVFELQRSGRPHLHWLIRVIEAARACGWKIIRLAIARHGGDYGIGRSKIDERIRSAGELASYLTKAFRNAAFRVRGMRVIGFWGDVQRVRYEGGKELWDRAVAVFMRAHGVSTKEELTEKLGVGWPFRFQHEIYAGGSF